MSSKHSSRFPRPFRKPRPATLRRIVAVTVFLCAVGLAAVESLTPRSGHIRVVISAKSIAAGASVTEQDVAFKDIPRDLVPGGAVTDIAAVRGRTLATGMSPGEILTEQRMVGPSLAKSLTGTSESKIIAITLTDVGIVSALRMSAGWRHRLHTAREWSTSSTMRWFWLHCPPAPRRWWQRHR